MHETLDFRSREMLNFGFLEKYLENRSIARSFFQMEKRISLADLFKTQNLFLLNKLVCSKLQKDNVIIDVIVLRSFLVLQLSFWVHSQIINNYAGSKGNFLLNIYQ